MRSPCEYLPYLFRCGLTALEEGDQSIGVEHEAAGSGHLLLFPLAPALPFALSERFLKGRRFTGARFQESLNLVQNTLDGSEDDPTVLFAAYGSNALLQSQTSSKLGRNHNLSF